MGILTRLFCSTEALANEAAKDEGLILESWAEYKSTIPKKQQIIGQLPFSYRKRTAVFKQLKSLLTLELADIHRAEQADSEIVEDIYAFEHDARIVRIEKLERCLAYTETKFKYVYELLRHLYSALQAEGKLLKKDTSEIQKYRKLVQQMQSELAVEMAAYAKLDEITTFKDIFLQLAKGEHIIRRMDAEEKKLVRKMQKGMAGIFQELRGKIQWPDIKVPADTDITLIKGLTIEVFNHIEKKFRELEEQEIIELHPDSHFEVVNRPDFVDLVREDFGRLMQKRPSESMVNAFVHIFREWFNHNI